MSVNLELRRKALQVLGWRLKQTLNGYWSLLRPDGSSEERLKWFHDDSLEAWDNAPGIESVPSTSEPMFLEWCEKNGYSWEINSCSPHEQWTELHVVATVHKREICFEAEAATPSEARAKAIVTASEGAQ